MQLGPQQNDEAQKLCTAILATCEKIKADFDRMEAAAAEWRVAAGFPPEPEMASPSLQPEAK